MKSIKLARGARGEHHLSRADFLAAGAKPIEKCSRTLFDETGGAGFAMVFASKQTHPGGATGPSRVKKYAGGGGAAFRQQQPKNQG